MQSRGKKIPSLVEALIPLITLISLLSVNVHIFKQETLGGPSQVTLILSAAVAAGIALRRGHTWAAIQHGIINSISIAMPAVLILLMIGALSGTWLLSGVVPAMIYYGLKILHPSFFLVAACIICAIVSSATGSSWSTIATIGVALLGIGKALGWSEGIIAGAIISGSYFGDKISPLSDTTILAASVTGIALFTHVRYMLFTSIPSLILTLLIFGVIGFTKNTAATLADTTPILEAIEQSFHISPWLFLIPLVVIVMIVKKVDAIPALFIGAFLGIGVAIFLQPQMILHVSESTALTKHARYIAIIKAMYTTINVSTSNTMLDNLLSTSGMAGMMDTIWLIIAAMTFGGVMEAAGMLKVITRSILGFAHSTGALITSTTGACIFFNLTVSDQYLAILIPGKLYAPLYKKRRLQPQNLSRVLEDTATVTSPLVPWSTCGATQSTVLGVATLTYLPYCFFNIISPLMSVLFGYLAIKIAKTDNLAYASAKKQPQGPR